MSPLAYGYNAFAVNEMYASRWMNRLVSSPNDCLILYFKNFEMLLNFYSIQASDNVTKLGAAVLNNFDIPAHRDWYWIGAAALSGFIVLFNVLFTFTLMYLNRKF